MPTSSPSFSRPNIVLTPPLALNSTEFPQHVKLSQGKDTWARILEEEVSFTVELHDLHAVIWFSASPNLNPKRCSASYVRVALVDSVEQSELRIERENVVSLENIREGVEEVVNNVIKDS
jgi:hypothetical protein